MRTQIIKIISIFITILVWILSVGAERNEPLQNTNHVDCEAAGFKKMHTTAYCLHGTTATGGSTRPGIAACNTHIGECAMIYTLEGEYLTTVEITDKGITEGLTAGTVIDVWFNTYEEAEDWMRTTGGRCFVLWVDGKG